MLYVCDWKVGVEVFALLCAALCSKHLIFGCSLRPSYTCPPPFKDSSFFLMDFFSHWVLVGFSYLATALIWCLYNKMLLLSKGKTKQIDLIRQKNYKKALEDTPSTRNPVDLIYSFETAVCPCENRIISPLLWKFYFCFKVFRKCRLTKARCFQHSLNKHPSFLGMVMLFYFVRRNKIISQKPQTTWVKVMLIVRCVSLLLVTSLQ